MSRTLLPGLYHELAGVLAVTVAVRQSVDGSVTWMLQAPERTNAVAVVLRRRRPIRARAVTRSAALGEAAHRAGDAGLRARRHPASA